MSDVDAAVEAVMDAIYDVASDDKKRPLIRAALERTLPTVAVTEAGVVGILAQLFPESNEARTWDKAQAGELLRTALRKPGVGVVPSRLEIAKVLFEVDRRNGDFAGVEDDGKVRNRINSWGELERVGNPEFYLERADAVRTAIGGQRDR